MFSAFAKLEGEGKITSDIVNGTETVYYDGKVIGTMNGNPKVFTATDNIPSTTEVNVTEVLGDGSKSINCKGGLCELVEGGCVTGSTLIRTSTGSVMAKDVKAGMLIKSYDENTTKTVLGKVLNTFTRGVVKLYKFFIGKDTLQITGNHPVYTKFGNTWRYLSADSLVKGMVLLTLSGNLAAIDSIATEVKPITVYNFEIKDYHNYYAGNSGFLVHNNGGCWVKKYTALQDMDGPFFIEFIGKEDKLKVFEQLFGNNALIKNQFKTGGSYRIKAWIMASEELPGTSKLLTDPGNIQALSTMYDEMNVFANFNAVPGFAGLTNEKRMQRYLNLLDGNYPCATCSPSGLSNIQTHMMPTLAEQWENIKFIDGDKVKYGKYINDAGIFRKGNNDVELAFSARHGAHYELIELRKEVLNHPISGVNGQMPVAGYTSQYDFTTGVWGNGSDMSYHLHECKSIGGSTLDKIGDGVWDKFNQFLDGLGSVPSLNNYHLHFNPAAFAGDPLRAKKALHGLFEKKSEKIFQRLFGNPTLSTNLFQGRTEAQARIFFLEKINPTDGTTIANNTFFNFVQ